jgi:negative regulator of sigma E activity
MQNQFSDELISAYLDGEVTADERAQVEQTLRDSSEHRHMYDELRTLRSSLQSLPRCQLDEGFSDRVLRRAERAMLEPVAVAGYGDETINHTAVGSVQPASRAGRHTLSKPWYAAIWVSAVVAAALVLALFVMPRGQEPNIVDKDNSPDKKPAKAVVDAVKNQPSNPVTTNRAEGEDRNNDVKTDDVKSEVFPDTPAPPSPKTKKGTDGSGQDRQAHIDDMVRKAIARLDLDNDGTISAAEAASDALIDNVFAETDKDANGQLDADEIYEYLNATLPPKR